MLRITTRLPLLLLLLALVLPPGCKTTGGGAAGKGTAKKTTPGPAKVMSADGKALIASTNDFSLRLLRKLALAEATPANTFASPTSVAIALGMVYAGAKGETAEELRKTLALTLPAERAHPAFAQVSAELSRLADKTTKLALANRLWGAKAYPFEKPFLATTREHYGADLINVDFAKDAEAVRKTINGWVGKVTAGEIPELLKDAPPADTRLILTNAIYFKAAWTRPFEPKATRKQPFTLLDGKKVDAPLMSQTEVFRRGGDGETQVLALPYRGDKTEMVLLLPRKPGTAPLRAMIEGLTPARLKTLLGTLRKGRVMVSLPRFKLRRSLSLNSALGALGAKRMFTRGAQFGGMSKVEGLYVAEALHEATVTVNERGTVAAAATAIRMMPTSMPPVFRADRPFAFLIRDTRSGALLFVGLLADPR
jgi:serpin B